MVAFLAQRQCELTGEVFSAAFGRVSRVFIGSTPGWFSRDFSAEDVESHLAEILSDQNLAYPKNLNDEVALAMVHYHAAASL